MAIQWVDVGNLGTVGGNRLDSKDLAQYMEASDRVDEPWLWVLLRLKKLEEERAILGEEAYLMEITELHQSLMDLGEWWVGREDEVF